MFKFRVSRPKPKDLIATIEESLGAPETPRPTLVDRRTVFAPIDLTISQCPWLELE